MASALPSVFGSVSILAPGAVPVSAPGEPAEQEADRMAAQALGMLRGAHHAAATPRATSVQREAVGSGPAQVDGGRLSSKLGAGRGLDAQPLERMQAAFGTSFAHVRIHDDEIGAHWARRLGADAFTLGAHVAFARGKYRPGTSRGEELLAHELAHTLQQRGGAVALQRRTAGGCAETVDVDEQRDELARAGNLAHRQIQSHFEDALFHEVRWPRATKEIRGDACPPAERALGKFDLWNHGSDWGEIGEIKSVEGVSWGLLDMAHYLRRSEEVVGRLRRGTPCPVDRPPDPFDVERDERWFGGRIRRNGLQPDFRPLARGVPTTPARLGPFWGNPRKRLSCELRPGGVVAYWCTRGSTDEEERQRQAQSAARPVEERRTETQRRPQVIRVVALDPLFEDAVERIPPRMAEPGRRWVLAIDAELYDQRRRQWEEEDMQRRTRLMQIDPRGVPMIQLTAPLIPLAVIAGALELGAVVAAVVAIAVVAAPAAVAASGAVAVEATTATAATATLATGTYTTATGIALTVIEGGGGAVAAGTTTVGAIAKGSAAAAAVIAAIAATSGEANAAERAAPYLDRPLVLMRDVTGASDVPRTITSEGRTFRVIVVLSSEQR